MQPPSPPVSFLVNFRTVSPVLNHLYTQLYLELSKMISITEQAPPHPVKNFMALYKSYTLHFTLRK